MGRSGLIRPSGYEQGSSGDCPGKSVVQSVHCCVLTVLQKNRKN